MTDASKFLLALAALSLLDLLALLAAFWDWVW